MGLGAFRLHYYALCIASGIVVALILSRRRYRALGGIPDELYDLAAWLIPAGVVGGRLYHVITSPELYFGVHGHPWQMFAIWNGGMGIWGAVAAGVAVAYLWQRKAMSQVSFPRLLDVLAPGVVIAQAIGRLGNWFNGELFGSPTKLPWGLSIPMRLRPEGFQGYSTFQPTFLYELLWCAVVGAVLLAFTSRLAFAPGSLFALYVTLYSFGRFWIEGLRIDPAHHFLGLRLNQWVAVVLFTLGSFILIVQLRARRGRI